MTQKNYFCHFFSFSVTFRFFRDFQPLKGLFHTFNQGANFEQFLAKTVKIIKKALGTFFSRLQALTNCKVSEKSNERFPRKSVAHGRTDGRTDSWSRDQKTFLKKHCKKGGMKISQGREYQEGE